MSSHPTAIPAPSLNLAPSSSTCTLSIINTTCNIVSTPPALVQPPIAGHDWLNLPTYSFLIEHQATKTRLLFDLGCRTDWQNLVPFVANSVSTRTPGIRVDKDVPDILAENGVDMSSIKALILSHWHFDHMGNLSRLHPGSDLLVGPGFRDAFFPGYPSKPTSGFHESDVRHINVLEVPFDGPTRSSKIGDFTAYDYFGDGSLYILNVPGHTVGHISALVRTTAETAVFLGGDVCHFPGVIRPSAYNPMPDPLPASTVLDSRLPSPCPCAIFSACHPSPSDSRTAPFYQCATGPESWYEDPVAAMVSINALKVFDADPNVLVLIAHDPAPREVMEFFPHATVNDWKAQGLKDKIRWHFVNELPVDGKPGRQPLVDGKYLDGARIKDLHGNEIVSA